MVNWVALALMVVSSAPLFVSTNPEALPKPLMVPPMVNADCEQVTLTLLTFAAGIVPLPLLTEQVQLAGCVCTVTAYGLPKATWVGMAKLVAPESIVTVSLPFVSTRPVTFKPLTAPLSAKDCAEQVIATLVRLDAGMVPVLLDGVQVSPAGELCTLTA